VKKTLLLFACIALIGIGWFTVLSMKSEEIDQEGLINAAERFIEDSAYVSAIPLLETAVRVQSDRTARAEELLKMAYLNVDGLSHRYTSFMNRMISMYAYPSLYMELALYYLDNNQTQRAISVLRTGVEETGDSDLAELYERERYAYSIRRLNYDYVGEIFNTMVLVMRDGLWGVTDSRGVIQIPCMYEKISTFSNNNFVVLLDGEIFTINARNQRTARLRESAIDFGNLGQGLIPIQMEDQTWRRATFRLNVGSTVFDQFGMYSGGFAASKVNGKWGVIGTGAEYLIAPTHDGIVMDSLGRAYGQGAVFVREGNNVRLFIDGQRTEHVFDDAYPFNANGWAAVMKNGKWGFIDANGKEQIPFSYDDARSFNGRLAAVEVDGLWGYISTAGKIAIDPQFLQAKSFNGSDAPVLSEDGWMIISLIELN
jgi:tetratricopeptide (TPR) repeat protein